MLGAPLLLLGEGEVLCALDDGDEGRAGADHDILEEEGSHYFSQKKRDFCMTSRVRISAHSAV